MNTSRKAMEWFICFSIVNLILGWLLFKKFKKFNESCQNQHILNSQKFAKSFVKKILTLS